MEGNEKPEQEIKTHENKTCHDTAWCIDDMESNLLTIVEMLKRMGLEVKTFIHPNDVIDELKTTGNPPDVIFTDLWMDEMPGDKLAKIIKKLPHGPAIPIIAVTIDDAP